MNFTGPWIQKPLEVIERSPCSQTWDTLVMSLKHKGKDVPISAIKLQSHFWILWIYTDIDSTEFKGTQWTISIDLNQTCLIVLLNRNTDLMLFIRNIRHWSAHHSALSVVLNRWHPVQTWNHDCIAHWTLTSGRNAGLSWSYFQMKRNGQEYCMLRIIFNKTKAHFRLLQILVRYGWDAPGGISFYFRINKEPNKQTVNK